jgi:hypothetical protein
LCGQALIWPLVTKDYELILFEQSSPVNVKLWCPLKCVDTGGLLARNLRGSTVPVSMNAVTPSN